MKRNQKGMSVLSFMVGSAISLTIMLSIVLVSRMMSRDVTDHMESGAQDTSALNLIHQLIKIGRHAEVESNNTGSCSIRPHPIGYNRTTGQTLKFRCNVDFKTSATAPPDRKTVQFRFDPAKKTVFYEEGPLSLLPDPPLSVVQSYPGINSFQICQDILSYANTISVSPCPQMQPDWLNKEVYKNLATSSRLNAGPARRQTFFRLRIETVGSDIPSTDKPQQRTVPRRVYQTAVASRQRTWLDGIGYVTYLWGGNEPQIAP